VVTATDASPGALAVARRNAELLGAAIAFHSGDWYDALPVDATFDLIVSNPPYVAAGDPHLADLRFEPMHALTDGLDGLACLRTIAAGAGRRLAPRGWLLVEHGYDQAAPVAALFARSGLGAEARADGAGHLRVTLGQVRQVPV
jgi:release factor glutamine methyltransferase